MNASKTLISAIAAATIVGTVGFVSAQTTTPTTTPTTQSGQSTEPVNTQTPRPMDSQQPANSTTSPVTTPSNMSAPAYVAPSNNASIPADATVSTDLQPKADRN